MAKLGKVKRRWLKQYEVEGVPHRTEYAERENGSFVKKDSYRQFDEYAKKFSWHDWGWTVVRLREGTTAEQLVTSLTRRGFSNV